MIPKIYTVPIQDLSSGDRLYQLLVFNKEGKLPEVIDLFAQTDGFVFAVSTNHAVNQGEYLLDIVNYIERNLRSLQETGFNQGLVMSV